MQEEMDTFLIGVLIPFMYGYFGPVRPGALISLCHPGYQVPCSHLHAAVLWQPSHHNSRAFNVSCRALASSGTAGSQLPALATASTSRTASCTSYGCVAPSHVVASALPGPHQPCSELKMTESGSGDKLPDLGFGVERGFGTATRGCEDSDEPIRPETQLKSQLAFFLWLLTCRTKARHLTLPCLLHVQALSARSALHRDHHDDRRPCSQHSRSSAEPWPVS